jgi:hypothetical protein
MRELFICQKGSGGQAAIARRSTNVRISQILSIGMDAFLAAGRGIAAGGRTKLAATQIRLREFEGAA